MEERNSEAVIDFVNADIMNGESIVIRGMDMSVRQGDFVYITGKVGSGKTSIIRSLTAENPVKGTRTVVCGTSLADIREKDIPFFRRHLGVVFQDFQLLMDRNVNDNLEFVLRCTGWKDEKGISARIEKVLADVGMETKRHKMPFKLSGGEQQRIAIARALLNSPALILADEPTGNLDNETADGIMHLLKGINSDGAAVVMVTHNNSIVDRYPGRVFVCENERCTERP